ncbi:DHA2 family efflux MFS transporter permease subunit [Psychromicrobium lacuslunae]|uniref:DHA2 family efflux MFS transporter permease subunit n=1 Tax=Psychromicrobium lacuslunae TaxID=1618207 RepID=UPI0006988C26|nr:DHA2 family efflux MFS transporter permease subunit [Psychromicrobium lacuslunae]
MSSIEDTAQSTVRRIGPIAATLIPGGILSLLSATIIGIAVPEIAADFPADAEQVHWVATAALLAAGVAIPISGWASGRFGIRRTWLVALSLLTVSSVAVALAPSLPLLIVFRIIQGLGAGALEPVMLTALARAAGPARMGRVMGIAGASMSLGPLVGPLLGGLLVESIGWRWIFAIIATAAIVILVASAFILPRDEPGNAALDLLGLLFLSAASVLLLAGLSRAATASGVDGGVWALLGGGIVALLFFVWWLRRRGEQAIIDPSTFRARGFAPGVLIMLLVGAAIYPLLFGLPQFYREAVGLAPVAAGLLIGPYAIGTLTAMPMTGRLSDRIGARPLVVFGAILTALAATLFVLAGAAAPLWWFALLSLLIGLGTGSVGGPTVGATYRALTAEKIPSGSTVLFVSNQIGGALGIAIFAGIITLSSPSGTWTSQLGTLPLVLPVIACLAIALLAIRLDRAR